MISARTLALSLCVSIAALASTWVQPAQAAAQCDIPEVSLGGEYATEMSNAFTGFIMENTTGAVQEHYAQKLIDSYMTQSANAAKTSDWLKFRIEGNKVAFANKWFHVLKVANLTKAVAAGEYQEVANWAQDEAIEKSLEAFLKNLGATSNVPVAGVVVTGLKIVKESYEELEVQDCLLNIDNAYYNFLEDDRLRTDEDGNIKKGAVDAYIKDYLFGGGEAPGGTTKAQNRRNLQCYVNNTLPEAERVEVSTLGADSAEAPTNPVSWFNRVMGTVADVAGSAADVSPQSKRLRTPIGVMLRDFNNRYDIELEARKFTRLRQSPEFAEFENTIKAMEVSSKAAEWLCERFANRGAADLAGIWILQMEMQYVPGEDMVALDPIDITIPENGMVLTKLTEGDVSATVEGMVTGDKADLDVLIGGRDGSSDPWTTIANVDLDGAVQGDAMSGTIGGTVMDMACMVGNMFEDDASKHVTCGNVPTTGTWSATKK
ncbi:hypothetical protein [Pyruvatibacter sp.]|uniref:hypothetical protein n=1 Tax=Pyruvatibacter sp. TaxID=1981328 RepID=UPI003263D286